MASCDSFRQIFKTPLPENPTLLDSLSPWNQIKSPGNSELSPFTELFGELHFNETTESSSSLPCLAHSLPSSHLDEKLADDNEKPNNSYNDNDDDEKPNIRRGDNNQNQSHMSCHAFSPKKPENLQLCTEGLGFESFDDMEDLNEKKDGQTNQTHKDVMHSPNEYRRMKSFPPPISSIGRSGKPWVSYKSFRQDGRFVLKEVRVPTQEFLHASRENGCLKLHLVLPNDEFQEWEERENMTDCGEADGDDNDAEVHSDEKPE